MGGGERQKMKEKEQGIARRMDAVQRREREVRRKEWEEGGRKNRERKNGFATKGMGKNRK